MHVWMCRVQILPQNTNTATVVKASAVRIAVKVWMVVLPPFVLGHTVQRNLDARIIIISCECNPSILVIYIS